MQVCSVISLGNDIGKLSSNPGEDSLYELYKFNLRGDFNKFPDFFLYRHL